ncbi:MAG: hypothetical protein OXR73_28355 [Myxococcales bacterium]|nr:hypothetical protein [Myxococcales bacterium]
MALSLARQLGSVGNLRATSSGALHDSREIVADRYSRRSASITFITSQGAGHHRCQHCQSIVARDTIALCDDIRTALGEEASELCEHASEDMDFEGLTPHVRTRLAEADHASTGDADAADKRASAEMPTSDVIVRCHRFARNTAETDRGARRIVIHRDRRRGRLVGTKHGADPPD